MDLDTRLPVHKTCCILPGTATHTSVQAEASTCEHSESSACYAQCQNLRQLTKQCFEGIGQLALPVGHVEVA